MKPNVIIINERDNVAVALVDIAGGEKVILPDGREIMARGDIPFSHKVALKDLTRDEEVIKYGEIIGRAGEEIKEGGWVHTHNLVVGD